MPAAEAATRDLLESLDAEQRAVVQHGHTPLLVVAGPGSGKTLTLAARVAQMVADGTDPRRILLLSFSRRAAAELARRCGLLMHRALGLPASSPAPLLPWAGTFHSVAARLLRAHSESIGLERDFSVIDRADAEELMAHERTWLGLHERSAGPPGEPGDDPHLATRTAAATPASDATTRFPLARTCVAILSRCVNASTALHEVLAQAYPWCAAHEPALGRLFDAYAAAKQAQRLLDYDDLLLYWHAALQDAAVARAMAARFDRVLVDEFQDCNRLQAGIVHALAPDGRGVTVVGDDAQAIYGFRAADVESMLGFPQRFTPPATVRLLERSHRCTQPVLAAANAVMAQAGRGFAKTLSSRRVSSHRPQLVQVDDESGQARWVADEVLRERELGTALVRQAVLFRTAHHSAALELELARRRIPFVKFGGLRFLEAAHVKDLLALLRWSSNLRCRLAGQRVVRLAGGVGPAAAMRLLDAMDASADPASVLAQWAPPRRAAADWAALRAVVAPLIATERRWPDEIAPAVDWLVSQLPRLYGDDAPVRAIDLRQLGVLAAGWSSRERFLTEITLDPPEASSDEAGPPHRDDDWLTLSTIHSAKGREWQAVHVLNVVDGCLPSDLATGSVAGIDEERRLLYVAMTRARERLHLIVPQRFHVESQRAWGSRHVYAGRSRFLPPALDPLFDLVTVPPAPSADEAVAAAAACGGDVRAGVMPAAMAQRVKSPWRGSAA